MIEIVEGDLLKAKEDIIGHQVNCQGKWGGTLASQFKNQFPDAFLRYEQICNKYNDELRQKNFDPWKTDVHPLLGKVLYIPVVNEKFIANIFGQIRYGKDGLFTNYQAIETAFTYLKDTSKKAKKSVALPMFISCGHAGGSWEIVYNMLDTIFSDYELTLYKKK